MRGDFIMVRLADIFTDHCILQRNKPIRIFGTGEGSGTVQLGGNTVSFTAQDDRFCAVLPPMEAGGPYTLTVTAGDGCITLRDVLIGDVFFAGGQSNMAFSFRETGSEEWYDEPSIRLFTEGHAIGMDESVSYTSHVWESVSRDSVADFSAIGYFFALEMHRRTGVPVGVIACAVGASCIDAWTAPEIAETEEYRRYVQIRHSDFDEYPFNHGHLLYLHKLLSVVPYTVAGILWYQGESNRCHEEGMFYDKMLTAMIANWRQLWQEELPFYIVQLMPYHEGPRADWAIIREKQEQVTKTVPQTYLVTPVDTGESPMIHPVHKKRVAQELANAVRRTQLGDAVEYCGPVLDTVTVNGNTATLTFTHADKLVICGGILTDTVVIDADGNRHPVTGTVTDGILTVEWDAAVTPVAIAMGYCNDMKHNLYNADGYWASPFYRKL